MVVSAQGDRRAARFAIEEGLRGVRELGDTRLVGWFLIFTGRVALAGDDAARARRRFQEALDWERRLADDWGEAWALQGLAAVGLMTGDQENAFDLAIQSLTPAKRAHSRPAIVGALHQLATLAHRRQKPTLAATLLGAASIVSAETADLWGSDVDGVATIDTDTLKVTMGSVAFSTQWARGRALTTDEAVTIATRELSAAR
jgi:hypothetical protein